MLVLATVVYFAATAAPVEVNAAFCSVTDDSFWAEQLSDRCEVRREARRARPCTIARAATGSRREQSTVAVDFGTLRTGSASADSPVCLPGVRENGPSAILARPVVASATWPPRQRNLDRLERPPRG